MNDQGKLRILVIEDSPDIRDFLIEGILKPHEFEVETAADGIEGLHKAVLTQPDLILMDYELPRLTGLQVLRKLRHDNHRVPVILMTSHGSEQIAVEFFRLGIHDYLIKPFKPSEMLDAIENALSVHHLEREKEALTYRMVKTNQELEQRLIELNELYSVGKSITALKEPHIMLERIVDAVLQMTNCEACTLYVADVKTGELKRQIRKEQTGNESYPNGANLLKPPFLNGYNTTTTETQRELFVPLRAGDKVVGTIGVKKRSGEEFTEHNEKLLRMLGDYAAIAIHNLQLMHQLHVNKEREKKQIRGLFERYVAPTVVEQLLTQPDEVELGGTRRTISVLFADVRGFSSFSARTSPEVLVQLLNQYMRVAADAILDQQGTLDKFMGDAVMAFFNAPLSQPNHPLRAIRAAWALCQSVKNLHRYLPESHRLHFGVGVGVGEAVVGNIGTSQMMNYTVIGDSVNKIKRLQENAKGGQILISQETRDLVHDFVEVKLVGDIHLKGQSRPEPIYEILGLREPNRNGAGQRPAEAVPLLGV